MKDNASTSAGWLIVRGSFLVLFCLLAFAFTLFGLGMDGMRHSRPRSSLFDPYYIECWGPSLLATPLLLTLLVRISRSTVKFAFCAFLLGAVAWLLFEAQRGNPGFGASTALLAAVAVFVWRSIVGSRLGRESDAKIA
jgi:hypothetical protein